MGTIVVLPKGGRMPNKKLINSLILGFLVLVIIGMGNPFVFVGPGERGVKLRWRAVQPDVLSEGPHFVIPLMESVVIIDVKQRKIEAEAPSYSHDLQNVQTKIALNYHVDPTQVNKLYQEIRRDFESQVIMPAVQEAVKGTTAKYTAAELIEQRAAVRDQIKALLHERLETSYLIVDNFSIVDFEFSQAYAHAIEDKQVEQQKALKAENELRRIKVEAEQRVAQATAEAEAIRLQAEALRQNTGLIQLEAVKKWDGKLPQYMMGQNGATPFVNVSPARDEPR